MQHVVDAAAAPRQNPKRQPISKIHQHETTLSAHAARMPKA
jgi:hypothetical protein